MTQCLECDAKIGWFKKPVDGVYCSERCRDEAHRAAELAQGELRSRVQATSVDAAIDRRRLEAEAAAMLRTTSEVVRKSAIGSAPCPKCNAAWAVVQGGGSFGRHSGECAHCGFQAEFLSIEGCPHCRCPSLVVESMDDARCPRCKSRPRRRRQIA